MERSAESGFNEAEARASESLLSTRVMLDLTRRFNEAEARASESPEGFGRGKPEGSRASMRPRRVPRNHWPPSVPVIRIEPASMRPRRVPRNHDDRQGNQENRK